MTDFQVGDRVSVEGVVKLRELSGGDRHPCVASTDRTRRRNGRLMPGYRYQVRVNFDADCPEGVAAGDDPALRGLFAIIRKHQEATGLDLAANASRDAHNVTACRDCHDNTVHGDGEPPMLHDEHPLESYYCVDCRWSGYTARVELRDALDALDAAQDEIEKRIEDAESLRAAFTLAHAEVLKHHERVDAPEPWCQQCSALVAPAFADWPCDPVRAIEDALGGAS